MKDRAHSRARIVIADDHPLFASALGLLIEKHSDLQVVGAAANGREALEMCHRLKPDLVLMDIRMPEMDGVVATRILKRQLPQTVVLIMTASEEPDHLAEALKAGSAGYVLKTASPQQIIGAIRRALVGESPLNQEIAMQLLLRLMEAATEEQPPSDTLPVGTPAVAERQGTPLTSALTAREVEVLRQVAQGHSNQQIAQELYIAVSTVKKHLRQIISKLGVSDRTQAAILAIESGLRPDRDE